MSYDPNQLQKTLPEVVIPNDGVQTTEDDLPPVAITEDGIQRTEDGGWRTEDGSSEVVAQNSENPEIDLPVGESLPGVDAVPNTEPTQTIPDSPVVPDQPPSAEPIVEPPVAENTPETLSTASLEVPHQESSGLKVADILSTADTMRRASEIIRGDGSGELGSGAANLDREILAAREEINSGGQ